MIGLKPMRELVLLYKQHPDQMSQLLSKVTWYVYGGFNFRCINDTTALLSMLTRFKKVYIYESFHATGQQNSVNKTNCPELYQKLSQIRP